jgi:elongation factor Ts
MNQLEQIRVLRNKTFAGMQECKNALESVEWDVEKAVDVIKARGQLIADARSSKLAAEGTIAIYNGTVLDGSGLDISRPFMTMVEVNAQTDWVSKNDEFQSLAKKAARQLAECWAVSVPFKPEMLDAERKDLITKTKENIVIRRWFAEEAVEPNKRIFSYLHGNGKIGVLLVMTGENEEQAKSKEFDDLGNEIAMQVAAMAPLAVSIEELNETDIERQKAIFLEQVKDKPEANRSKIIEGKLRKWYTEVCLVEQESVMQSKKSIKQLLGSNKIVKFVRVVVGEGIEIEKTDLAKEVEAMTGVHQHDTLAHDGGCLGCGENDAS